MSDVNIKRLMNYPDELNEIFRMYVEDITPFVIRFESDNGEFPIEIQNEIRAMFNHMARAVLSDNERQIESNIKKMRSHAKRALLDCFKYVSMLCDDQYHAFMSRYENVDLTLIDEGRFLADTERIRKDAVLSMQKAKKAESVNTPEDELFCLYQIAYEKFDELNARIQAVSGTAEYLSHKAAKRDRLAKRSYYVGIIGTAIGIIGLAVAFFK